MTSLPDGDITYQDTRSAILREFGTQVLLGAGTMVEHNAKLAMKNAVNPYKELYWTMNLFLGQEFTMVQMLDYLCRLEATHDAPNKESPIYNCPANTNTPAAGSTKTRQTQERQIPLTDITCYYCQNKGHYATKCPNGQKVHVVYVPTKDQGKDQAQ
ncbi:Cleavage and polyadenylation specificity factor subunit 4 [Entomophthora muscae]|uniref:Cleavage and polyadenylation specificity factor subunit 4 n=1 Tax=Entomophthora muscae TaxID=34485 RepID=A0ACC2UDB9_9FUNG|nr:Cleavage and polyadenylation specificity factor subunit 4 [Entomophthora muscae]